MQKWISIINFLDKVILPTKVYLFLQALAILCCVVNVRSFIWLDKIKLTALWLKINISGRVLSHWNNLLCSKSSMSLFYHFLFLLFFYSTSPMSMTSVAHPSSFSPSFCFVLFSLPAPPMFWFCPLKSAPHSTWNHISWLIDVSDR